MSQTDTLMHNTNLRKEIGHICQGRRHAPEKNQDFATSGRSSNGSFDYLVVADGHDASGGNDVNKYLSELNWKSLLENPNFMDIIYNGVEDLGNTSGQGSTLTIVIITQMQAEIYWIGDSQVRIYKNLEEIWKSNNHDFNNHDELNRLNEDPYIGNNSLETWRPKTSITTKPSWRTKLLSQTEITMEQSNYFVFGLNDTINMTHCLGHNSLTGRFWNEAVIDFVDHMDYKIVAGSDGLWDMLHYKDYPFMASRNIGINEILQLANDRWSQEWSYFCPKKPSNQTPIKQRFPSGQEDDISIAVWYRGI